MAFPQTHTNGEVWNGTAVSDLEARAASYIDQRAATAYLKPSGGDDSAAMATALTSFAPYVSAVIVLGPGTFLWNSRVPALARSTPTRVIGSGIDQTIIKLSSGAPRFLDCPYVADYDTYRNIEISDLTVDCNNVRLAANAHVVIGNLISGGWALRQNVSGCRIRRVKTINVPNRTTTAGAVRHSVSFGSTHLASGEATQTSLIGIVCEDCEFNGGDYGFSAIGYCTAPGAFAANVFMDRNGVDGLFHDVGVVPTAATNGNSAHVQFGGHAFGERCFIKRLIGNNSRDVGTEVDGHMSADFEDCEITDAFNAAHGSYNFQQPRDPYSQVHTYHKCRVRMKALDGVNVGTFIGWECGSPNTPAGTWMGTVVLDDVVYDSAAPNWVSNGVVVSTRAAGLRRLVLGPMNINVGSINQTLTQTTGASLIFIDPTSAVPCSIEGHGPIDARIAGTVNLNGFGFNSNPFFVQGQPNADITFGVRAYRPNFNLAGVANSSTRLVAIGPSTQYTTTVTGTTTGTNAIVSAMSSTASLTVGQLVTGAGIPANTYIASIDSASQVTLTKPTTAAGTGVTFTVTQCPIFRGDFHYQVAGFSGSDTTPYVAYVQTFQGNSPVNPPLILLDSDLSFPFCDARKMPNPTPGVETGREVWASPQSAANGSGQFAVLYPGLKIAGGAPATARSIGPWTTSPRTFTNLQFGRRIVWWLTGTGTITQVALTRRADTVPIPLGGQISNGPYFLDHGDSIEITTSDTPAMTMQVIPSRT